MPISIALIRKLEEVEPRLRGVLFAILEEIERQREETVTKKEFNKLKLYFDTFLPTSKSEPRKNGQNR